MRESDRISNPPGIWRSKALLRLLLLLVAAAAVAAFVSSVGVSHDYGHLRALLLSGVPGGYYHTLATRVATRAKQERGNLIVVPTAGSVPKARGPPISCVSSLTTQTYGGWISGSLTTNWPSKRDWSAKENSILLPS